MKLSKLLILPLFILAANYVVSDNLPTNSHSCYFYPSTRHETDKKAIIYVSSFSVPQKTMIPYPLGRSIITLSAFSGIRASGHHTYITTFSPCSCGKTNSKVVLSPSDVNPETYTWSLTGNIPGIPKSGYKDSYSEQVVVSESGSYSIDTYFTGKFSCGCPEVSTPIETRTIDCFKEAKIIELKATDASTTAGVRESTTCLYMVRQPDQASRKATINLKKSGDVANGWPQWTGVSASAGSYAASWESTLSIDGKVGAEIKGMCDESDSKSVSISVVEAFKESIDIPSEKLKKFQEILNICLVLISGKDAVPPTIALDMKGEMKRVDYYNDGNKWGNYFAVGGSGSITLGQVKGKVTIPTTVPGVKFNVGGEIKGFYFTIGGDFKYDESVSNPWVASQGSLSAGAEMSVFLEGVIGQDELGVIVTGTASAGWSITGTLEGKGKSIVANATLKVPAITFTATAKVKVLSASWKIAEYSGTPFGSTEQKSGDVVLWPAN